MTFAVKNEENLIDPIGRQKHYKRQISQQQGRSKEGRRHTQTRNSNSEREREREREREVKLETMHYPP